jgi:hypothetical protein
MRRDTCTSVPSVRSAFGAVASGLLRCDKHLASIGSGKRAALKPDALAPVDSVGGHSSLDAKTKPNALDWPLSLTVTYR